VYQSLSSEKIKCIEYHIEVCHKSSEECIRDSCCGYPEQILLQQHLEQQLGRSISLQLRAIVYG
jgi:hypothetical protein